MQTPVKIESNSKISLQIGDPIFFRPAKSGEIAEQFNYYHIMKNNGETIKLIKENTYRGLGKRFF